MVEYGTVQWPVQVLDLCVKLPEKWEEPGPLPLPVAQKPCEASAECSCLYESDLTIVGA